MVLFVSFEIKALSSLDWKLNYLTAIFLPPVAEIRSVSHHVQVKPFTLYIVGWFVVVFGFFFVLF